MLQSAQLLLFKGELNNKINLVLFLDTSMQEIVSWGNVLTYWTFSSLRDGCKVFCTGTTTYFLPLITNTRPSLNYQMWQAEQ